VIEPVEIPLVEIPVIERAPVIAHALVIERAPVIEPVEIIDFPRHDC
jgi:hypothetical protein